MKFLTTFLAVTLVVSLIGQVSAAKDSSKPQSVTEIRADILATITSINELRLMMIKSDIENAKKFKNQINDNKSVAKLTTSISNNSNTLKDISDETKSNNIRLSILEKRTFSKADNDFNEYITSSAKKVFKIQSVQSRTSEDNCDAATDTYTYQRTSNEESVEIKETITRHGVAGNVCFERDVHKRKTHTELLYVSNKNKIYNDYPVNDFLTYHEPVIVLTSSMKKGIAFGGGGTITYESNGSRNTLVYNKVSTLLSADAEMSLTVNNAEKTYFNCMIIGTRSNSTVSTEWYCPGDGLVKRIIFYPAGENKAARSEIITLKSIAAY